MNNLKPYRLFFVLLLCKIAWATGCDQHCVTPFGQRIGQSFLTPAYSNCSDKCTSDAKHYLLVSKAKNPTYTGMKWQCVEYARRWFAENKGYTFPDVKFAYSIWELPYAKDLRHHRLVPWLRFKDGRSNTPPKVGDLLIYGGKLAVTGHVAVIVGVDPFSITLAEQNYFNRTWEGKDYARRLMLDRDEQGLYHIVDVGVIGWMRVYS